MASIDTKTMEHNQIVCSDLDDLMAALHAINDEPDDIDVELSIVINVPGVGAKKLRLLDDVGVLVAWTREVD